MWSFKQAFVELINSAIAQNYDQPVTEFTQICLQNDLLNLFFSVCVCLCAFNYSSFSLIPLHLNHKRNSRRIRCVDSSHHWFECLSNIFFLDLFVPTCMKCSLFVIDFDWLLLNETHRMLWIRHKISKIKKENKKFYI